MKNTIINLVKKENEMVALMFANNSTDEMVKVCVVNAIVNSNHPQKAEMLVWLLK